MSPVTINVGYRLREYLSIVWDFAQYASGVKSRGAIVHPLPKHDRGLGLVAKAGIALIAIPVFFYKVLRVGRCQFIFSESGLTRKSKKGGRELQVPWPDVQYVYPLSQAYLIAKAAGAMPIPYRCLTGSQREQLDSLFSHLNAARNVA